MRIYTRYQAPRRRPPWRSVLQGALAFTGLAAIGWILYHHLGGTDPSQPPLPPPTPPYYLPATNRPATNRSLTRLPATPPAPRITAQPAPPPPTLPAPAPLATNLVPPQLPAPAPSRPATNLLEAQIALARQGLSAGPIDGVHGYQTRAALRAFQQRQGLPPTGRLDSDTRRLLTLAAPPLTNYVVTSNDLARLMPIPTTWLGKSQLPRLDYSSLLELVAETHRAHPNSLRRLNPDVDWTAVAPGRTVVVPDATPAPLAVRLAFLRIALQDRALRGFDLRTNLLLHFPCSIAARMDKRPVGRLEVVVVAINPTYTFNPEVFPESAEGRQLNRKLTLPPGPNNPVGVAWIGLDRPGYGIHGTPRPEDVGRTESHGCFRLANWDAAYLAPLVWRGLPVYVEP